ncbi:MAG: S8 family serine peptidase [Candidatus Aminicenantes bacterium]|nr:MAG: S8 family serine peptidase [Candidatus Aminicenantes bacterium]
MKLKKRVIFTFTMVFVVSLMAVTTLLTGSDSPFKSYEDYKYDQLKKIASQKGFVRVMVKLDVPDIEALTLMSTGFKTGNADESYIQAAYNADLALEEAISLTRDSILHQLNGNLYRVNRTYSTLPYVALSVTAETLDKLRTLPQVLDIVEDKLIRRPFTEIQGETNDISRPMVDQSVEIVGADVAWGLGYTGAGWYVAILDTGLLTSHEMFQGKNIIEQCYALGDDWYDKVNGACPNGLTEMSGPGSAAPYESRFGHGTHVAGIAAGNNHNNHFGVAKEANIIAVQVFSYFPGENDVLSWSSDQLKGLEFVYTLRNSYNIAAANLSLGAERYFDYCDTDMRKPGIDNLRAVGIATVISSGNEGHCDSVCAPACISSAIAVNGTDKQDRAYMWGNWHDVMVHLMAPGDSIRSADSTGNSDYGYRSGTSMSAPHVTGAWAIMKQFDGNMTVEDILSILQDTGPMISSSRCPAAQPKARINVGGALFTLLTLAPPINPSGQQVANRALLRTEYINQLTWESNPLNEGKNVSQYKIYVVQGSQLNFLAQVSSSTFSYLHRNVVRHQDITYAFTAVDAEGQESLPIYYTLEFGVVQ